MSDNEIYQDVYDKGYAAGHADGTSTQTKAARAMLAALKESQEALDVLAGDVEDTFPVRAEAAADLAMRLRAAIAQAEKAGITMGEHDDG